MMQCNSSMEDKDKEKEKEKDINAGDEKEPASAELESHDIHSGILTRLQKFIETRSTPNIIFHGPTGAGKRTVLNTFIHMIYSSNLETIKDYVMFVNCAQGKGIKFIREDLKLFAKTYINTHGGNFFKSIVLMNADKLTIDAQSALRRCIEVFSHTTRFFIVVEDKYKLLKPILSRFCEIYVPLPIIHNKVINLHQYEVSHVNGYEAREKKRIASVKKIIGALKDNVSLDTIKTCAEILYYKGFNAIDVVTFFQQKNPFNVDSYRKHSVLFHFNQIKREFRNEILAMVFLFISFLLCSNDDLENIILM